MVGALSRWANNNKIKIGHWQRRVGGKSGIYCWIFAFPETAFGGYILPIQWTAFIILLFPTEGGVSRVHPLPRNWTIYPQQSDQLTDCQVQADNKLYYQSKVQWRNDGRRRRQLKSPSLSPRIVQHGVVIAARYCGNSISVKHNSSGSSGRCVSIVGCYVTNNRRLHLLVNPVQSHTAPVQLDGGAKLCD